VGQHRLRHGPVQEDHLANDAGAAPVVDVAARARGADVERAESIRFPEGHVEERVAHLKADELVRGCAIQRKIWGIDTHGPAIAFPGIVAARAEHGESEEGERPRRHEFHACATARDGSSACARCSKRVCRFVTHSSDAHEFATIVTNVVAPDDP
jgi:hypothetical protein